MKPNAKKQHQDFKYNVKKAAERGKTKQTFIRRKKP